MGFNRRAAILFGSWLFLFVAHHASTQQLPPQLRPPQPPPAGPDPIEKVGDGLYRVGTVRVDTARKEVTVRGTINDVSVLEFLVNTKGGFKAYESAIEADTSAVTFNVGLLLIGLDPTGATHPPVDRGPIPPKGPEVDVLVEWDDHGTKRTVHAEELITILPTNETLPRAAWIYTGSMLVPERKALRADMDGVLIGFMHTSASLIDHGGSLGKPWGAYRLNTGLIKAGTAVTVIVRTRPQTQPKRSSRDLDGLAD